MQETRRTVFLFSVLSLSVPAALLSTDQPQQPQESLRGGAVFVVAPAEFAATERLALDGSAQAAGRLYMHFQFGYPETQGGKDALFWLTIAAENGSASAQCDLGMTLLVDPSERMRRRGLFWIKRAADAGLAQAVAVLAQLSSEMAAIRSLRQIVAAERTYETRHEGFLCDPLRLVASDGAPEWSLVRQAIHEAEAHGYQIEFRACDAHGYSITASYRLIGSAAGRTFCLDETGTLRVSPHGGTCNDKSPVLYAEPPE